MALFAVAIIGAGLALTGQVWHTGAQREKEAELLFVGNQYRKAIERYYLAGSGRYPQVLEDLVKDPRQPATVRHLRRLYPDPVGDSGKWGLIYAPQGGILGIHSLSDARPLKNAGFGPPDIAFERATTYSDWKFIFVPGPAGAATPGKPVPQPR